MSLPPLFVRLCVTRTLALATNPVLASQPYESSQGSIESKNAPDNLTRTLPSGPSRSPHSY